METCGQKLHKTGMVAFKALVRPGKTLRINLGICTTFNADMDGDEMNIHLFQSEKSAAELNELMSIKNNLISTQSSKPIVAMVQDTLLSWYLMTKDESSIPKEEFFDILMRAENLNYSQKLKHIKNVYLEKKGRSGVKLTGKALLSFILPDNFFYKLGDVLIYKGVHLSGAITSRQLGRTHNAFTQLLYKEYGENVCITFINNIQYFSYQWMCYHSFSVNLNDCIPPNERAEEEIKRTIAKSYIEAKSMKQIHNSMIREAKINEVLNNARDIGMRIAKDEASSIHNNFLDLVQSGAKGNWFNIAQITSLLGQQNLLGKRVNPMLCSGRTLHSYPFKGLKPEDKYESRGFIHNSFIHGLNPKEYFFHACSGREGVVDTSSKTSVTGYISHRCSKVLENLFVAYDGTVRDDTNKVIQFKYNEDGIDPTQSVMVDGIPQFCDVSRIVEKLNNED